MNLKKSKIHLLDRLNLFNMIYDNYFFNNKKAILRGKKKKKKRLQNKQGLF